MAKTLEQKIHAVLRNASLCWYQQLPEDRLYGQPKKLTQPNGVYTVRYMKIDEEWPCFRFIQDIGSEVPRCNTYKIIVRGSWAYLFDGENPLTDLRCVAGRRSISGTWKGSVTEEFDVKKRWHFNAITEEFLEEQIPKSEQYTLGYTYNGEGSRVSGPWAN